MKTMPRHFPRGQLKLDGLKPSSFRNASGNSVWVLVQNILERWLQSTIGTCRAPGSTRKTGSETEEEAMSLICNSNFSTDLRELDGLKPSSSDKKRKSFGLTDSFNHAP